MSVAENKPSGEPEPDLMSIYMLDTSWATTADDLCRLNWELLVCEEVHGTFLTSRIDGLAVLFSGDRRAFHEFESGLHGVGW
jgi:hypothetical protein